MLLNCTYTQIKYYKELLTYLHLDAVSFLEKMKNKDQYEGLIYQWIKELYHQQKPIKEAKCILQEKRYRYYFEK